MFSFRSLLPLALVVILASTALAQTPGRTTIWGPLLQSLTAVMTQGGDGTPPRPPRNPVVKFQNGRMWIYWTRSLDDTATNPEVTSYELRRADTVGDPGTPIGGVAAARVSRYRYRDTTADPTTTHYYWVKALAPSGESAEAGPAAQAPPQPPSGLTAVDGNNSDQGRNVRVEWLASPDDVATGGTVRYYRIRRATAADPEGWIIGKAKATGAASYAYTDLKVNRNKTYRYYVKAESFGGWSAEIGPALCQPTDEKAPRAPSNLRATDPPDNGTTLDLSWDKSPDDGAGSNDVAQYRVYKMEGTDGTYRRIAIVKADGAAGYQYTATDLTKNTLYQFTVRAFDLYNESADAFRVRATPLDEPPAPPSNLAVADWPDDDGTSLRVTFDASPEDTLADPQIIRYDIYRADTAEGAGAKVGEVIANQSASYQYRAIGLTPKVEYWLWAYAVDDGGPSVPSNKASGIPVDVRPVRPPLNLTAVDRPYDNGGIIDLGWDRSGDDGLNLDHVTKYYIYRRMANVTTDPEKIGEVVANDSAHYDWPDTTVPMELILYEYTVTAVSVGLVESVPAGPVQASSENNNVIVFQPPTNFTVADVTGDAGGQLLLTWNRSTSEGDIGPPPPPPVVFGSEVTPQGGYGGEYDFYRRPEGGSYGSTPTFIVSAAGTNDPMTYVDVGLTNGVRYYYKALYRRYNQISNFTAEVSAIPVNNQSGGASVGPAQTDTADDPTADTTVSTDAALSAQLVRPPSRIPAGQDALLTAAVRASGAASVALQYSVNGGATLRTAAQSGTGSFRARIALPTATLRPGSVIRVRAVATSGGAMAVSEVATILVR
jgi:hypothetical protein